MKSLYRTTCSKTGEADIVKNVLSQPSGETPAIDVASDFAASDAGAGYECTAATLIGDVNVDATAGGTGTASLYSTSVRNANGIINPGIFVLAKAIGSPATSKINAASDAAAAAFGTGAVVINIISTADVELDATA